MEKPFPAERPILEILSRRWSGRAIDPDRPVSRATVLTLIEAARVAPSSFNEQPWRFLVFDGADGEALVQARSCLVEGNAWAKKAPLLLLSVAAERWGKDGSPNRHAQHDVGLASENLALQAIAEGLVVHFMAGFDAERARELFGIPESFTPMAMIAVGYPGDVEKLPPKLHDRELAPRRRKPIEEIAFAGTWDRPFTATLATVESGRQKRRIEMKRTLFALAFALVAATATAADKDRGLADLDKAWTKAMLANDPAAVGALYAPDALMYPPDAMELKGREAIQKSYEAFLGGMKVLEAKLMPARYETHGDTSIGWGRWALKMAPKAGGDPVQMEGRYMAVAKKINGKWLYVADHASSPLPPPPATAPAKK